MLRAVLFLAVVWAAVLGIRALAGSKRVTAEKVGETIAEISFEDWSEGVPPGRSAADREKDLERVADMFNRLDFAEREEAREKRVGEVFFRRLSPGEKQRFASLTIAKTMEPMIRALDAMSEEERRQVVERGLRDIESGRTEEEMARAKELGEGLLEQITSEGMKAYFEEASGDTKLDLAPLVEAMDEVMKGMRGPEYGPPR